LFSHQAFFSAALATLVLLGTTAANASDAAPQAGTARAIFAGGCFWCMEPPFEKLAGVKTVVSGYIGGTAATATYNAVSAGGTGHAEAVEVVFDPNKISYAKLLEVFWMNVDPFAKDRQFCDGGTQYRAAIFPVDEAQSAEARMSLEVMRNKFKGKTVQVQIEPNAAFFAAEDYHQDYYKKNPARYKFYRWNCGRDQRLQEVWGTQK
jgi:peptide-methionine (S)-S-oxide reductase